MSLGFSLFYDTKWNSNDSSVDKCSWSELIFVQWKGGECNDHNSVG